MGHAVLRRPDPAVCDHKPPWTAPCVGHRCGKPLPGRHALGAKRIRVHVLPVMVQADHQRQCLIHRRKNGMQQNRNSNQDNQYKQILLTGPLQPSLRSCITFDRYRFCEFMGTVSAELCAKIFRAVRMVWPSRWSIEFLLVSQRTKVVGFRDNVGHGAVSVYSRSRPREARPKGQIE